MAEERTTSLEGEVVLAMQRLLVRQEAHIQEWTALWDHIFHSTHNDFRQAQSWQDFGAATDLTQRRVEWMSMPENSGVLMSERLRGYAEQRAADREALQHARHTRGHEADMTDPGDPAYLGWQAEQRFFEEQDPMSEWYREDLYHGEPGPDVAAAWERRDLFIVGDDGQLERPEWMDVLQELGSQAKLLHDQHNGLEIDTSDPDMGASWQQTLEHLQARLDALERDFPAQHRAQGHNRDEGIGY